jgi:hypothetical protein
MYSCTLSLTSALDVGGWLAPRPGRFTPGKEIRYPLYSRLGGHQVRSGQVRTISPPAGIFFVFSCTLYFIRTCSFVLIIVHVAFCPYLQHITQTSVPPAGFEPVIPASDRQQTLALG